VGTVFEVFGAVVEFVDFFKYLREYIFKFSSPVPHEFGLFFFSFDLLLCTLKLIDKFFILIL
jgi:hypothetical protein